MGVMQQLDNQSLLILYASDELGAEDRSELEGVLTTDGRLRAELESIQLSLAVTADALGGMDDAAPLAPSGEAVAVRRVGRVMRQWQVDRLRADQSVPAAARRFPLWTYPVGAVASLIIVGLIFWGRGQNSDVGGPVVAANYAPEQSQKSASPSQDRQRSDDGALVLARSFQSDDAALSDAETQANSLVARSDDAGITSSIFLTGNPQ